MKSPKAQKQRWQAIIGIALIAILVILLFLLRECTSQPHSPASAPSLRHSKVAAKPQTSYILTDSQVVVPPNSYTHLTQSQTSQRTAQHASYLADNTVPQPVSADYPEQTRLQADTPITDTAVAPNPPENSQRLTPPTELPKESQATSSLATSNPRHQWRWGFRVAGGYARIERLGGIIEDFTMRPQHSLTERGGLGLRVGGFVAWQYGRWGIDLGGDLLWMRSTLEDYSYLDNSLSTSAFHQTYITPYVLARYRIWDGLYMGAGTYLGIPISLVDTDYKTNRGSTFATANELTRLHLRESIQGKLHLMPTLRLGYVLPSKGLDIALEYSFAATDLLRTRANPYGYHEIRNNGHLFQVSLTYSFPLNK